MSNKYKVLFDAGNAAQLEKLQANEHKDGWNNIDIEYARDEIWMNFFELDIATNLATTRSKAADIANFAHMIILACDTKLAKVPKEDSYD